jgi:hypothetical protein
VVGVIGLALVEEMVAVLADYCGLSARLFEFAARLTASTSGAAATTGHGQLKTWSSAISQQEFAEQPAWPRMRHGSVPVPSTDPARVAVAASG